MKKLLATAIAATGAAVSMNASAVTEGELTIWIGGDKAYNGLQAVGDWFEDELGVPVTVETPEELEERFQQEAALGRGPDLVIWAHDRFGSWADSGFITEIEPSDAIMGEIEESFWESNSYDGVQYGWPVMVEAVGLIYNREMVSEAPTTWDEVFALDAELREEGKNAILWDYNNTYFTYPLLSSAGGYSFGLNDDGTYNPNDIGFNNDGAKAGAHVLKRLIDEGVMPSGADYGDMDNAFVGEDVAMVLNGPWAWAGYQSAGIDIGVAPIPAVDGDLGKSFVGVPGAVLNAASPNGDLAQIFMEEYLLTVDGLQMMDTTDSSQSLGVPSHQGYLDVVTETDEDGDLLQATFDIAADGDNMPNIPQMDLFWANAEVALANITEGRQTVEEALDQAAERMRE